MICGKSDMVWRLYTVQVKRSIQNKASVTHLGQDPEGCQGANPGAVLARDVQWQRLRTVFLYYQRVAEFQFYATGVATP